MSGALVTFYVSDRETEVRDAMLQRGYEDSWEYDGAIYDLPDSMVWKENTSLETALTDLRTVASACDVVLEGSVIVESLPFAVKDCKREGSGRERRQR